MPFQGINDSNIRSQRFLSINYATAGFAFNHATEAGLIGLRKPAKLSIKSKGTKDYAGRSITDSYEVKVDADLLQTTFPYWLNIYKLSKAYHQLQLKNANGEYYPFVNNGGTIGTPTGSALVGLGWEFNLSDTERSLKLNWETMLFDTEYTWMMNNVGSGSTGGSSGTTGGLTAMAYDRSKYIRPGIIDILINGVSIGRFQKPKISIKSKVEGDRKDYRNRPIPQSVECKSEVTLLQSAAADIKGAIEAGNADYTIAFKTANDETIQFVTGANSINFEHMAGDTENHVKLTIEGSVPYNLSEATPNAIDIGVTASTTASFNLL